MARHMRVATAIAVVQGVVESHIERKTQEADRGRDFLAFLTELSPSSSGAPPQRSPKKWGGAKSHINPGTLEDRILEIVREHEGPISRPEILTAKTGAKEQDVTNTIRSLVRAGHLEATGGMRARRYHIPGLKMRRSA